MQAYLHRKWLGFSLPLYGLLLDPSPLLLPCSHVLSVMYRGLPPPVVMLAFVGIFGKQRVLFLLVFFLLSLSLSLSFNVKELCRLSYEVYSGFIYLFIYSFCTCNECLVSIICHFFYVFQRESERLNFDVENYISGKMSKG